MNKIKETIELIQSAKRDLIIEKNQAAALITLDLATDILANIKTMDDSGLNPHSRERKIR